MLLIDLFKNFHTSIALHGKIHFHHPILKIGKKIFFRKKIFQLVGLKKKRGGGGDLPQNGSTRAAVVQQSSVLIPQNEPYGKRWCGFRSVTDP
jgi:hypothetical protein